jgi:hypothetical protein
MDQQLRAVLQAQMPNLSKDWAKLTNAEGVRVLRALEVCTSFENVEDDDANDDDEEEEEERMRVG